MKKVLITLMAVTLIAAGCAQPLTKTQQGAGIGTGVGAAAGAGLGQAIGGDTESTLIGAGIGAVVGGLAGGSIGSYMDKQEAALQQAVAGVEGASIQRQANTIALTFKSDVMFDVNSASLKPGAYDEINRVANVLSQYPQTRLTISGHTDSTGSEEYNLQLSQRHRVRRSQPDCRQQHRTWATTQPQGGDSNHPAELTLFHQLALFATPAQIFQRGRFCTPLLCAHLAGR
jgi:outer membrane protein OmpA-like peptidoglycan-associated protein